MQGCFKTFVELSEEGQICLTPSEDKVAGVVNKALDAMIALVNTAARPISTRNFAHFYEGKPACLSAELLIRQATTRQSCSPCYVLVLNAQALLQEQCGLRASSLRRARGHHSSVQGSRPLCLRLC